MTAEMKLIVAMRGYALEEGVGNLQILMKSYLRILRDEEKAEKAAVARIERRICGGGR